MIIIDRFEGDIAVVEYKGKNYDIPRAWLPVGAREGDVVKITLVVDEQTTAKRRGEMERKVQDLFD